MLKRSRRLMLIATGISFVSQFLRYSSDTRGGMLRGEMDTDHYTGISLWGQAGGTGWQTHPLAIPLLAALAIIYNSRLHESPFWVRRGHWGAVVMIFLCSFGQMIATFGGMLGGVALALSIFAAILHRRALNTGTPE